MTDPLTPPADPIVKALGEIRDVLAEIRDQLKPAERAVMPTAVPIVRPGKSDRTTSREHIIG